MNDPARLAGTDAPAESPVHWQNSFRKLTGRWLPPAFAITALVLILVVPYIVNRQVAIVRAKRVSEIERAQVYLNDLEAAFASDLLLQSASKALDLPSTFKGSLQVDRDAEALHSLAREMDPQAMDLEADLAARLKDWKTASATAIRIPAQDGMDLLTSAEKLDAHLGVLADSGRAATRRLERYYLITPMLLTPIALVAMLIVVASARRERQLAAIAQNERARTLKAAEARASLMRGVTHDVKNPLGAAAGYVQLLEEGVAGDLAAPQADILRRIRRLLGVAVQTVTDLLELAHSESDLHVEYTAVDVATIVAGVAQDHEAMARERALSLRCEAPSTRLVTDPVRVQQILSNLITNAVKYTPAGGAIEVRIRRAPDGIGIDVADTGPGIPPELRSRLFEEFFRVRTGDASQPQGNGLGLAISRRIARLIGGDVTYADAQNGGSVFTLWLSVTSASTIPKAAL